ncbi:hypothetical protein J7J18_06915 [bacterium]|nr:hypothetical protein [bacterium]
MIYLHEVQSDLSSKIESVLTDLDQTYNLGLIRAPVIVSSLPEDRVTPSTYLKMEEVSSQEKVFFRCTGTLLVELSFEIGEDVASSLIRKLGNKLQDQLERRNNTTHTYYSGSVKRVTWSLPKEEMVRTIKVEFEVQGIEQPI